ncbi:unnamed protein product [Ectocarpus fasciculatus]
MYGTRILPHTPAPKSRRRRRRCLCLYAALFHSEPSWTHTSPVNNTPSLPHPLRLLPIITASIALFCRLYRSGRIRSTDPLPYQARNTKQNAPTMVRIYPFTHAPRKHTQQVGHCCFHHDLLSKKTNTHNSNHPVQISPPEQR